MKIRCLSQPLAASLVSLMLATSAIAQNPGKSKTADGSSSSPVVRVGVPLLQNKSTRSVSRTLMRDWLARAFETSKKKKTPAPTIEAIALDADSFEDAMHEARDKKCDYVLFTTLVALRSRGEPQPIGQPGPITIGRNPLGGYPDSSAANDPVLYAELQYQLQRLGEGRPQLDLTVSGQERADENIAVQRLLFNIANRVTHEIRNPEFHGPE